MSTHGYDGDALTEGGSVRDIATLTAQALGPVLEEGNAHVVIVPDGASAQIIDLDAYASSPWTPSGTAKPKSVEAFIDYVKRHANAEFTTIWVEPLEGKIVAVLNDHGSEQAAAWGDLRAVLDLPVTPEWEHWMKRDGKYGGQQEFAEHIEEGLPEIVEPDGATMLEIAQSMQATVTASFKSASRLSDGSISVLWDEHVDARAGAAGELTMPQTMRLGIAPFYGEQPYEVTARIRYRIASGELRIGYKLDRPDVVVRDCLGVIAERIREQFGGIVFAGTPAPARRRTGV